MLPPKLTEICSLTFGQKKRAFSIIILLKKTKNDPIFNILNIKFMKTLIVVTRNLSYEEAEIDENITIMYDVGKHLYKQYVNSFEDNYDTHKMVEAYMILANVLSAEFLVNKDKDSALLRRHTGLKTINSSNT
jgi:exoribonuclease R